MAMALSGSRHSKRAGAHSGSSGEIGCELTSSRTSSPSPALRQFRSSLVNWPNKSPHKIREVPIPGCDVDGPGCAGGGSGVGDTCVSIVAGALVGCGAGVGGDAATRGSGVGGATVPMGLGVRVGGGAGIGVEVAKVGRTVRNGGDAVAADNGAVGVEGTASSNGAGVGGVAGGAGGCGGAGAGSGSAQADSKAATRSKGVRAARNVRRRGLRSRRPILIIAASLSY